MPQFTFASATFVFATTRALLGLCGCVANWALAYVTVRSEQLHNSINALIAVFSVCLSSFGLIYILYFFQVLLHGNDTTLAMMDCFWLYGPLLGVFGPSHVFLPAIAADRLFGVIFPLGYGRFNKCYFALVCGVTVLYALAMLGVAHANAVAQPDASIQCAVQSTLLGQSIYFTWTNIGLEVLCICLYGVLGIAMRVRKVTVGDTAHTNAFTHRVYRTMFAILVCEISGLTLPTGAGLAMQLSHYPEALNPSSPTNLVTSHVALCSCFAGVLILFKYSTDYRRVFIEHIPVLNRLQGTSQVESLVHVQQAPQIVVATAQTVEQPSLQEQMVLPCIVVGPPDSGSATMAARGRSAHSVVIPPPITR